MFFSKVSVELVRCIWCSEVLPYSFSEEDENSREMSIRSKKYPEKIGEHREKLSDKKMKRD